MKCRRIPLSEPGSKYEVGYPPAANMFPPHLHYWGAKIRYEHSCLVFGASRSAVDVT